MQLDAKALNTETAPRYTERRRQTQATGSQQEGQRNLMRKPAERARLSHTARKRVSTGKSAGTESAARASMSFGKARCASGRR
eukprot:6194861-Pleurochrysis_carterae.AAC.2